MADRKKPFDVLPEIPFGKRPKVLLVGNGLTLSFSDARKVDSIIQDEWFKHYGENLPKRNDPPMNHPIWNQPFPMQVVIATKDHVNGTMTGLAEEFKKQMPCKDQKDMIKAMLNTEFDAILTTNYSLEIERSVIPEVTDGKIYRCYRTTEKQTAQQAQFGIFQGTHLPYANNPTLWHIHGTALRKNSMVMGQFYYGKLLSEAVQRANAVASAYRKSTKDGIPYTPKSWVDYFLIGDIHCMGFSLDISESDIWWLLSLKKSAFPESSFYLYEPCPGSDIHTLLCNAYGLQRPDRIKLQDNDFTGFYKNVCTALKEAI